MEKAVTQLKPPTSPPVERLIAEHGPDLEQCKLLGHVFVLRPPTVDEWEGFQTLLLDGGVKAIRAFRSLALSCTVWPEQSLVVSAFEKYAGIPNALCKRIKEMSGADMELEAKKLGGG